MSPRRDNPTPKEPRRAATEEACGEACACRRVRARLPERVRATYRGCGRCSGCEVEAAGERR